MDFFLYKFKPASRIEQKAVEAITENKKIKFLEEYYKIHYLPKIVKPMWTNKKEVLENYLKTVAEYFSEEIKNMYEIES